MVAPEESDWPKCHTRNPCTNAPTFVMVAWEVCALSISFLVAGLWEKKKGMIEDATAY